MVTRGFLLLRWVTVGGGRWYTDLRGHNDGHTMMDANNRESVWVEVLARAEGLLQHIRENSPKGVFEIPAAHIQVVVAIFWRAVRLYDGVLVLLKNQQPEEAMFLARSLFEDGLRLQELAEDIQNRDALILCWVNRSIGENRGLLEVGKACGLDTDISAAVTSLEGEVRELQKYARQHGVMKFQTFLSTREAALKFGRREDYWTYHWAHESVHGSDASWMFAKQDLPWTRSVYMQRRATLWCCQTLLISLPDRWLTQRRRCSRSLAGRFCQE